MTEVRAHDEVTAGELAAKERLDFTFHQIASCPLSADIKERLLRCTVQKIAELAKFQDEILELGGHERDVTVYLDTLLTSEEANTSDFAKRKIRAFQRDFDGRLQTVKEQVLLLRSLIDGMRSKIRQNTWPEQKRDIAVATLKRHLKMLVSCKTTSSSAKLQLDQGLSKAIQSLSTHIKEMQKFSAEVDALHRMMNKIRSESAKLEELNQIDPDELEIAWEAMLHRLEIDPLSEVIMSAREVLTDVEEKAHKAIAKSKEDKQREFMENRRLKALLEGDKPRGTTRAGKGTENGPPDSVSSALSRSRLRATANERRSLPGTARIHILPGSEGKTPRRASTVPSSQKDMTTPRLSTRPSTLGRAGGDNANSAARARRATYQTTTKRNELFGETRGPVPHQPAGQSSGLGRRGTNKEAAESVTGGRPSTLRKPRRLAFGSRLDSRRSDPTEWMIDTLSLDIVKDTADLTIEPPDIGNGHHVGDAA